MAHHDFQLYHRPGWRLSIEEKQRLKSELRALGSVCLDPLPDYQVFSSDPAALDDKAIVTAHLGRGADRLLVGFTSAVLIDANIAGVEDPILHTGLTVIAPSHRQTGLPVQLFTRLFVDLVARYRRRIWMTSLSELPRTLVHFSTFVQSVYPSPDLSTSSETHLAIGRIINENFRLSMFIASSAVFEEANFVFRGSNAVEEGSCFRKNANDQSYWHSNQKANDYYRSLLRIMQGDEVLQVG